NASNNAQPGKNAKKLTYAQTLELEKLPNDINDLEARIAAVHEQMNNPSFYNDKNAADKKIKSAADMQEKLDGLYAKWEALEE
ncbi:MAG: ATP-binding cassette subfamily F protein uup, partial [bacterium]